MTALLTIRKLQFCFCFHFGEFFIFRLLRSLQHECASPDRIFIFFFTYFVVIFSVGDGERWYRICCHTTEHQFWDFSDYNANFFGFSFCCYWCMIHLFRTHVEYRWVNNSFFLVEFSRLDIRNFNGIKNGSWHND